MAPRRGQPQPQEEVEEEEEARPQTGALQFNEALSWKAGKPIAVSELLRRLQALADELREMDQEEIDKDSFAKVATELPGQHLLGHKDKGVRAYTGCCLVDVLKLCAPDAPFAASQLKDIFTFFITAIIPALSDPSNAYNSQHKYVLNSLAEVKSIVLLTDVSNAESLTLHLFTSIFDIISKSAGASTGESIAKDVEYNMSQILVTMVDEGQLPASVIDVIVAQFLRASPSRGAKGKNEPQEDKQGTLLPNEIPAAYNMAKTICNLCPEKMSRYISQYFNEVIVESSGLEHISKTNGKRKSDAHDEDEDEDETPTGPSEADMRELEKAHKLLRELWRASPAVLQNVIPQLEVELSMDNVDLRLLATRTLGDIISGIGAAGLPPPSTMDAAAYPPTRLDHGPAPPLSDNLLTTPISPQSFATTHPAVYQHFLGRKNDKSPVIRSAWSTAVGRILVTSAGGIGLSSHEESTLLKGLAEKLGDADDKVRLAAVKAVGGFGFRDVITKLASNGSVTKPGSLLNALADRIRDRRVPVRQEGMNVLSRMWGVAAGEIAIGNDSVIEALGGIPSKIFDAYYVNDKETNVFIDHVMFEQLIPLNYPPLKPKKTKSGGSSSQSQIMGEGSFDADKVRTERILLVVKSLDAKSLKAFFAMQARQPTYSNVLEVFFKLCEAHNGGVSQGNAKDNKPRLDACIKWLADFMPDAQKATSDLLKFAKLHDRRSYQLLRFAIAPASDFKTVNNAIREFTKKMKDTSSVAGIMDTFMPIIYRASSLVYNKSHNPVILSYSRSVETEFGEAAKKIINEISERHPEIFAANVKELAKALSESAPTATKENDRGSVDTLKALASFAKTHSAQIPKDRKFQQTLLNYASYGTPPRAAKYAVSILMVVSDKKEMHAKDILERSATKWEFGKNHFLSKLAALSQITLLDPDTSVDYNDDILEITTGNILLKYRTLATDDDPAWVSDPELDEECQAKCWALKILVNRLRTAVSEDNVKELAAPIFKLLNNLIENKGEMSKKQETPSHHRSHLLLQASQLMLKLCASHKVFDELVTPTTFNRLALVAQELLPQVRRSFIEKLQKYIVNNRLPNRYLTIIFLTAFEPDQPFAASVTTWIKSRAKLSASKNKVFEATLPRLLHLLAHHPDYSEEAMELRDNARYILHYLNTVATEDNIALIYRYAERVKQGQDALAKESTSTDALTRTYIYSDLATSLIRVWMDKKGWTMQSYPGKVGLPVGLFLPMPNHEVAQAVADKNYLPDDMDELLGELVRNAGKKVKSKKRKADTHAPSSPLSTKKPRTNASSSLKSKSSRPKKLPKPRKSRRDSTPTIPDSERRKSNRAAGSERKRQSYADREDSDDDEEMLDGVAEWEYEGGRLEKEVAADEELEEGSEDDETENSGVEEEQEEEKGAPTIEEERDVPDEEEEESPSSLPPPSRSASKSNGKRKSTSTPNSKTETSLPTRTSKRAGTQVTAPQRNSSTPKAKQPISTPKLAASTTTKGGRATRGKAKKDVLDMDDD